MIYDGIMDNECIVLCDAINAIPGLHTGSSCYGHGKELFRIWFHADSLKPLPTLLYFCDPCHIGFRWNCKVITDCAMSPVIFLLESQSKGEQAYSEANKIAKAIMEYLAVPAIE